MRKTVMVSSRTNYQAVGGRGVIEGVADAGLADPGYDQEVFSVAVPAWAENVTAYFNITRHDGTLPNLAVNLGHWDPLVPHVGESGVPKNPFHYFQMSPGSQVGMWSWKLGPGVTGIADDNLNSTVHENEMLGGNLQAYIYMAAGGASPETYSYTLSLVFSD